MENTSNSQSRWWLADKGDVFTPLLTLVRRLRRNQASRREMYRFYCEMYGAAELGGLGLTNYDAKYSRFAPATLPFNLVRSGINTVVARIAKNRPLPLILTDHGNYAQSKRAKGLSRYLEGEFTRLKVFEESPMKARDACVFGTGLAHIYADREAKRPAIERIFPWEILTEVADARYGHPRSIYTIRWIDKGVLKAMFPSAKSQIDSANTDAMGDVDDGGRMDDESDVVLVSEAWHLPSVDGAKDGRHVIAIDGRDLVDEKWTRNYFPFAFLRYNDPVIGFWGDGLAAELSGWQYELTYVAETLHLAHQASAAGMWLIPDGGGTVDAHYTNETGLLMKYKLGYKPEYHNPPPAHPQTYQYAESLGRWGLNYSGISQMAAHGTKPAGITANAALETLDDQETERFALFDRAYAQFHVDIGEQLIDVQKELAEEFGEEMTVRVPQRKSYLEVKWSDVDMARDEFIMQPFPVSFLGKTPAARQQRLRDLKDDGVITDNQTYLRLLGAPDLGEESDLMTAAQMRVDDQIEAILSAEDPDAEDSDFQYKRPDPFQDLEYAVKRGQEQVNLAELSQVPEANIRLLRQYIGEADAELRKKNPPQPAMSPMAGSVPPPLGPEMPPAGPMPPPEGAASPPGVPPGPPMPPPQGPPIQ